MKVPEATQSEFFGDIEHKTLADRKTSELVFGFVSPIGSGTSTSARFLLELLKTTYGYRVVYIKLSDIIRESTKFLGGADPIGKLSSEEHDKITVLQDAGNSLRRQFSPDYLARKCVERIAEDRLDDKGYTGSPGSLVAVPRRCAYVLDSLKNDAEIQLLKEVYGDLFFLIGVFASDKERRNWLLLKGISPSKLDSIMHRDEDEPIRHGQKVGKAFHQSDYFIRNDGNADDLKGKLDRMCEVIFGISGRTPTPDESAMLNAFSSASRSACLSRQVGAAIFNGNGELLGLGWNDVPRFGGGLYHSQCEADHRCYLWVGGEDDDERKPGICHNDYHKQKIYGELIKSLRDKKLVPLNVKDTQLVEAFSTTSIKGLIEFSRSVHAEIEAILSVVRGGKGSMVGGALYTTTFPCHNCARAIVAAGIVRVVFIEPYPKSKAIALHGDSISTSVDEIGNRTVFLQYEGLSPNNQLKYFKSGVERKSEGMAVVISKSNAVPVMPIPLDGFTTFEQLVIRDLAEKEKRIGGARV